MNRKVVFDCTITYGDEKKYNVNWVFHDMSPHGLFPS